MAGILKEGRNCWCFSRADRIAFLVEAENSLRAFEEAVSGADTIIIIGCDVDSRMPLRPGQTGDQMDRIFVSPREARIELTTETTHVTRVCSDHLPLGAAITLP